jgi:hypothetical protein
VYILWDIYHMLALRRIVVPLWGLIYVCILKKKKGRHTTFCLVQDILTKEIIGRGTKRGGIYYVDDFTMGRANHMHHPLDNKVRQLCLWHRRLGHLSFGYMKHLFPDLFFEYINNWFQMWNLHYG